MLRAFQVAHPRLRLAYFPPYAPQLNPDEGVWCRTKAELANGRPDDQRPLSRTLSRTLIASLTRLKRSSRRLRPCIAHADWPLHLP